MYTTILHTIYRYVIPTDEQFTELEIRAVKTVDNNVEWTTDNDAEMFGVYVKTKTDNCVYCIADCNSRESARQLCDTFNAFANNSLVIREPHI